ncbi:LysR family transcriptional regulator [Nocardia brasiliensis]|uniref:LysR family transcriptional regulator n=1 Tax=Nocardia brasiliensis TaxID=37326 RepID=UPI0024561A1B|nr:LysR family transcriptional regulator [Nocardia brasiliensis]
MELRQLRYLIAVAEAGSFTRAAARVHVAQPAISQQIAQLERELGAKIFDRSGQRIRLTSAGEAFLPQARAAIEACAAGIGLMAARVTEMSGQLRIGTVHAPPERVLGALGSLLKQHPHLRISAEIAGPEYLISELVSNRIDVAVVTVTGPRVLAGPAGVSLRPSLATMSLDCEPLVVAMAVDHCSASAPTLTISELRHERFVGLEEGSGLRAILEAACAETGFVPDVRAETNCVSMLAELLRRNCGVAVLPSSLAARVGVGIAFVELTRPRLYRHTVLAWNRYQPSREVHALVTMLGSQTDLGSRTAEEWGFEHHVGNVCPAGGADRQLSANG